MEAKLYRYPKILFDLWHGNPFSLETVIVTVLVSVGHTSEVTVDKINA